MRSFWVTEPILLLLHVTALDMSKSPFGIEHSLGSTGKHRERVLLREMETPKRLPKNMIGNENTNATLARRVDRSEQTLRRRQALGDGTTLSLHDLYLEHAVPPSSFPRHIVPKSFELPNIESVTPPPKSAHEWPRPIGLRRIDDLRDLKFHPASRSSPSEYQRRNPDTRTYSYHQTSIQPNFKTYESQDTGTPIGTLRETESERGTDGRYLNAEGRPSFRILAKVQRDKCREPRKCAHDRDVDYFMNNDILIAPACASQSECSSIRSCSSFASLAEARTAYVINAGNVQVIDVNAMGQPLTAT